MLLYAPHFAHAAVYISEVAWMGTSVSTNDEWIELHNDGSEPVSVDGWTLTDNVSLEITLAGTVGAGEYAVLERTDDTSAPGTAFLIYTGALANDGRTLTLKREDGSIDDQVAGGENWENIGGNNETKDTAQYTTSGWITAPATPGTVNADEASPPPASADTGSSNTSGSASSGTSKSTTKSESGTETPLPFKESVLALKIEGPIRAYVNQNVSFNANASGKGKTILNSLVYSWNFGDAETTGGESPSHRYAYPGEYVVFVGASFADLQATARQVVTVLPVTFSLTRTKTADIQINNDAKYEVDIGGFHLVGDMHVTIPQNTILLPNATLTIPRSRVEKGSQKLVALYDSLGEMVASTHSGMAVSTPDTEVTPDEPPKNITVQRNPQQRTVPRVPSVAESITSTSATSTELTTPSNPEVPVVYRDGETASIEATQGVIPTDKLPFLGLFGVIIIGILAVYTNRFM
jgi:hypothetical protein